MAGGDRENQTLAPPTANGGGNSGRRSVKEKGQKADQDDQLLEKAEPLVCLTNYQDEHSAEEHAVQELMVRRPRKIIKIFGVEIDCDAQSNVDAQSKKTSGKETFE